MPAQSGGLSQAPLTIMLAGHGFAFLASLIPERDAAGVIKELRPQGHYAKARATPLHKYGHGSFCRFRISVPRGQVGVYVLRVDGEVRYVGECEDLGKRFNAGYGNISPKNCYVGGRLTNCKINDQPPRARCVEDGRTCQPILPFDDAAKDGRGATHRGMLATVERLKRWQGATRVASQCM